MRDNQNFLNALPVKTGRPQDTNALKYDAELHCKMVRKMGQEGKFPAAWCANIGIHRATLHRWANKYPEFDEALKVAWSLCQCWWENKNQELLTNPNAKTALVVETLRKRFPHSWGQGAIDTEDEYDRRPRDITPDDEAITAAPSAEEIEAMPDSDIQKRIKELQARMIHHQPKEAK